MPVRANDENFYSTELASIWHCLQPLLQNIPCESWLSLEAKRTHRNAFCVFIDLATEPQYRIYSWRIQRIHLRCRYWISLRFTDHHNVWLSVTNFAIFPTFLTTTSLITFRNFFRLRLPYYIAIPIILNFDHASWSKENPQEIYSGVTFCSKLFRDFPHNLEAVEFPKQILLWIFASIFDAYHVINISSKYKIKEGDNDGKLSRSFSFLRRTFILQLR